MARPTVSEVAHDVYAVGIGRGALSTSIYLIRLGSSWTLVDSGWPGRQREEDPGGSRDDIRAWNPAGVDGVDPPASGPFRRHAGIGRTLGRPRTSRRIPACRWIPARVRHSLDR
jgi:hypothetical protein